MKNVSLFLLILLIASPNAFAQWALQNDESSLDFVTVKALMAGELNKFTQLSGSIGEDGTVSLNIDLNSVETYVAC